MTTGNIDLLSLSSSTVEDTNAALTALKPAGLFGYRDLTTAGLVMGLYGGISNFGGVATNNADSTITLTASLLNYVECTIATPPVISKNTSAFTAGRQPLYTVNVGATGFAYTDLTDYRGGLPAFASVGASAVTVADAAGDTTTWPLLATSQTGSVAPATDAGLTYNANTNALSATTFIGALTGTASGNLVSGGALGTPSSGVGTNLTGTASGLSIGGTAAVATTGSTVATTTNANFFPLFAASSSNSNQPFNLGSALTYNPSSQTLTAGTFASALVTVSGSALASPLTISSTAAAGTLCAFDNIVASSRGSGFSLAQNSAIKAYVSISGALLGTTASDLALYSSSNNVVLYATGALVLTAATTGLTSTVPIKAMGYTVGTLPAGVVGQIAYVTDQLTAAAAKGVAPTAGGAVTCYVMYDGAAWVGI